VGTLLLLSPSALLGQFAAPTPKTTEATQEPPPDPLGRNTPRGAILSFLSVARSGNSQVAALYLSTSRRGADAEVLAQQLAVVLNRRLPARLNEVSDKLEGSLRDPLRPDEDLIGTISTSKGDLDIIVERIDRGKAGKVWLFSRKTLDSIPEVFAELSTPPVEDFLPEFLVKTRVVGVPLFEWLALFVGMPFLYLLTVLLNRLMGVGIGAVRRHFFGNPSPRNPQVLQPPIRLLLLALVIRWLLSAVGLPLLARQFWSTVVLILVIAGCAWQVMLLSRWGERYLVRRRPSMSGSAAVLRLIRRVTNGLVFFAALLFALYRFGINPTAALAGLGVGGIAVALAAQKTLENVIAGISLIADQAVRVGDTLKLGDILGTVEDVGLRSTRIRTPDRTMICVPNGQIANMSLETLSGRDKFWFHPILALRYETNPEQLHSIIREIRNRLLQHPNVDLSTVRVNFLRINTFSLDLDIVAYVLVGDWADFFQIQEELLLNIMNIVKQEGAAIAFPSQTMYLVAHSSDNLAPPTPEFAGRHKSEALRDEAGVHQ
jgi:MscS family membrane protein